MRVFLLLLATVLSTAFPQFTSTAQKLETIYFIGGQVFDSSGKPACGFRVCAFAQDFDPSKPNITLPCAISDDQGKFSIAVTKPGRYKIFADHLPSGYWSQHHPFLRDPASQIPEVIVNDGTPRAPITIFLGPRNGLLVGRIVDTKTGLPVDNVQLILCQVANPQNCRATTSKRGKGEFKVPAPFGPFTFKVSSKGFKDWLGPRGDEQSPLHVPAGSTMQLNLFLIREDASVALTETEKETGVHLPAPSQQTPEEGATYNHYPRTTKLTWAPVEGAVSYGVEVDYCNGGRTKRECIDPQLLTMKSNPPVQGIAVTEYQFSFVGAQPGRWRVWAIDSDGREGFKSPWRTFFYLR
jgi:hypothetical protein